MVDPYKKVTRSSDIDLTLHVKNSIYAAEQNSSKLTKSILELNGMSSPKVRHFLNNVCCFNTCVYLEIGVWMGSTLISALYQNKIISATTIDNWSEFGGSKAAFLSNLELFKIKTSLQVIESDCFKVNLLRENKFNVYFYDGNHSEESQRKAFLHFNAYLADEFIAIVDDWNWQDVRNGTWKAFNELGYKTNYYRELPACFNGDKQSWWNGLFVAVIQKG